MFKNYCKVQCLSFLTLLYLAGWPIQASDTNSGSSERSHEEWKIKRLSQTQYILTHFDRIA